METFIFCGLIWCFGFSTGSRIHRSDACYSTRAEIKLDNSKGQSIFNRNSTNWLTVDDTENNNNNDKNKNMPLFDPKCSKFLNGFASTPGCDCQPAKQCQAVSSRPTARSKLQWFSRAYLDWKLIDDWWISMSRWNHVKSTFLAPTEMSWICSVRVNVQNFHWESHGWRSAI